MKSITRSAAALAVCALALAATARAELTPWDQGRVTELAKQLETSSRALEQSVRQQPPPGPGSPQRLAFFRLQQQTRQLRREAQSMASSLQSGSTWEQTLPSWESMMLTVRDARENARRVLAPPNIQQHADAARDVLNQLMPFFDANAEPLQPVAR